MQYELLIHSMLDDEYNVGDLESLRDSFVVFSKETLMSGCLVVHKNEVVHYVSGKRKDVLQALEMMKSSKCLSLIRNLHSGMRDGECIGVWDFVSTVEKLADETEDEPLSIENFLARLELARDVSIGLQLFSSVSEIILSERLYSLD